MNPVSRLRIFAGPNGSGKSTLFAKINSQFDCGVFINADEIKRKLDCASKLNLLAECGINIDQFELEHEMYVAKTLMQKAKEAGECIRLKMEHGVEDRVQKEGHNVPAEKILQRYYRSLENLATAAALCNRCYFFDNSTEEMKLLAELDDGDFISHCDTAPHWFVQYFLKPMKLV